MPHPNRLECTAFMSSSELGRVSLADTSGSPSSNVMAQRSLVQKSCDISSVKSCRRDVKNRRAFGVYAISGLMVFFSLNANVLAVNEPAASGGGALLLQARVNPEVGRDLALLKKQAEEEGMIGIIVGLRIAFVPEGGLTAEAVARQRNEIARMQAVVLDKVPSLKQRPESVKCFAYIPFMALNVTAAELEAIASLAEIASIEGDRLAAPTSGTGVLAPESK